MFATTSAGGGPAKSQRPVRPNRRLKTSELDEIAAAYRAGTALKKLAHLHGVDPAALKRRLRRAGVELRPQAALTDQQAIGLIQDYQAGASIRDIARNRNTSFGTVRNYLLRAGVELRPPVRTAKLG